MTRNTIFISHATPEDNVFAIWLTSRLEMLGYKIWLDKQELLGGEKTWTTIQDIIKNNAIKVLLVYSSNLCNSDGVLKDGIDKEIAYAESIAKSNKFNDFIIPLHIDQSSYSNFIGSNVLNHISFDVNWAEGLKQLLKKLEKDSVYRNVERTESTLSEWYASEYVSPCSIMSKTELFYSSWWKINDMPDKFYLHKFKTNADAEYIKQINTNIPIYRLNDNIYTFEKFLVNNNNEIQSIGFYEYSIRDTKKTDLTNFLKPLLETTISHIFKLLGLSEYKMSGKTAYFLPKDKNMPPEKIKFIYPHNSKKKSKLIFGNYRKQRKQYYWHYGVSIKVVLSPEILVSLKSHLIFTEDGINPIDNPVRQHSFRRSKGKWFFNEAWRDMQLAFIQNLKDADGHVRISVTNDGASLAMSDWPEIFISDIGYDDPKDMTQGNIYQGITDDYEQEE